MKHLACLVLLSTLLVGCSDESGDRDLAGAATGPATEIHCAGERPLRLERFPAAVGSTSTTVNCAGRVSP